MAASSGSGRCVLHVPPVDWLNSRLRCTSRSVWENAPLRLQALLQSASLVLLHVSSHSPPASNSLQSFILHLLVHLPFCLPAGARMGQRVVGRGGADGRRGRSRPADLWQACVHYFPRRVRGQVGQRRRACRVRAFVTSLC